MAKDSPKHLYVFIKYVDFIFAAIQASVYDYSTIKCIRYI